MRMDPNHPSKFKYQGGIQRDAHQCKFSSCIFYINCLFHAASKEQAGADGAKSSIPTFFLGSYGEREMLQATTCPLPWAARD